MPTWSITLAMMLATVMAAGGCDDPRAGLTTTQPVASPPTPATRQAAAQPKPVIDLPPKALVPLDKLEPEIAAPVGKPQDKPLPERVRDEYAAAQKLMAGRNFSAAVTALERAASFDPNHPLLLRSLGQAYAALRNRGKAEESLRAAVKSAPDDMESQVMLGELTAARQQNGQAIVHLRTALACSGADANNPRAAEALLVLGLLLDREGYWTAADGCYEQVGEWINEHGRDYAERKTLRDWVLSPERLLTRRGAILLLLNRPKEALAMLERAYGRNRTSGRTAALLVEALLDLKMHDKAERVLLDMIDLPSQRSNLPAMLDALCRQSKDRELPVRFWTEVAKRNKQDADIGVALARTSLQMDWVEPAVSVLASVAGAQPNHPDLWRLLGRHYAGRGDFKALLASLDKGLTVDPAAVGAMGAAMSDIATAATGDGAERDLAQLARQSESPNQHALLYLAGLLASAKNKQLLAADLYQRSARKKPDFAPVHEALLDLYFAQGRGDQVDRLLEQLAARQSESYLPHYLRGKVELRRNNADKAVEALQEALRRRRDDPAVAILLADAYRKDNQNGIAESLLGGVLRRDPSNLQAARKLFELYLASANATRARGLVSQLQARNPNSAEIRLMRVQLALAEGKRKEAMALLNQLVTLAPQDATVQVLYAQTLMGDPPGIVRKQDFDSSAEKLNRLIQTQPGNRELRLTLAKLLTAVGQRDQAAAVLAPLFEARPDDLDVFQPYVTALADANEVATALAVTDKYLHARGDEGDLFGRRTKLQLLALARRTDEARKLGMKWIGEAKDDNVARMYRRLLLGLLDQQKDYAGALAVAEAWLAANAEQAKFESVDSDRARLLALTGRREQSLKTLRERLAEYPLGYLGVQMAYALMEAGESDKAVEILLISREKTTQFAKDLAALRKAVDALKEAKDDEAPQAREAYEKAIGEIPTILREDIASLVNGKQYDRALGQVAELDRRAGELTWATRTFHLTALSKADRKAQSLKLARKWVADMPGELEARKLLIGEIATTEDWDRALKLLKSWKTEALFAPPTTASAELGGGVDHEHPRLWLLETIVRFHLAAKRHAEGLKLADAALKAHPKGAELLALRSSALGELGRDDEAEKAMEEAIQAAPKGDSDVERYRLASYMNNLAYILAVRGRRLDVAEVHSSTSLRLRPETAYFDTLAWVFYRQGRVLKAARIFQDMLEQVDSEEPGSSIILDHAGDAYWRLGWKDTAIELWQEALELGRKAESPGREEKQVLKSLPRKIDDAKAGRQPAVAPLSDTARPEDFLDVQDERTPNLFDGASATWQ